MLNAIEERIDKEFKGSPDQLLQLRVTVGDAYRNRGEVKAARRVFQRAVEEAAPHIAADDLLLLTARVRASDIRVIVSTAASEQLDRAIAILRNKSQRDTAAAELLLDALLNRHELQFNFGIPAYALPEHRFDIIQEANELALRHFGEGSRQHLRVVPAYADLASVMKPDAGPPIVESALQQARQRGDEATGSVEYLILHAALLCESGRPGEGGALLREAVERVRAAHGPTSVQLESLLWHMPACDEAALRWAAADAFEIAAARERPPSTQLMRRAMEAFNSALSFRDWASAERYYRSALENVEAIPEPALRDRLTIGLRSRRILQLAQRGDTDEAVQLAMPLKAEFDAEYQRIGRITPVQSGGFWAALSHAQRLGGRAADAEQTAQTFLDRCLVTMKTGPGGLCDQRALAVLALARLDLGRIAEAQAAVEQRLARSQRFDDDANFALAYGRVLLATRRTAEATEVLRQHYGTWLSMHPSSPYAAEALYWFGRAYQAAGDKRGDWMVPQAREALAKSPIASHRALARAP
jgi:tetratricopeptide (TPR) repeat protein